MEELRQNLGEKLKVGRQLAQNELPAFLCLNFGANTVLFRVEKKPWQGGFLIGIVMEKQTKHKYNQGLESEEEISKERKTPGLSDVQANRILYELKDESCPSDTGCLQSKPLQSHDPSAATNA